MKRATNFIESSRAQQYKIRKAYRQYRILRDNHSSESDESDTECDIEVHNPYLVPNDNNSKYEL